MTQIRVIGFGAAAIVATLGCLRHRNETTTLATEPPGPAVEKPVAREPTRSASSVSQGNPRVQTAEREPGDRTGEDRSTPPDTIRGGLDFARTWDPETARCLELYPALYVQYVIVLLAGRREGNLRDRLHAHDLLDHSLPTLFAVMEKIPHVGPIAVPFMATMCLKGGIDDAFDL